MQALINKVDLVNESLIVDIKDSHKYYGLVKQVQRAGENQNLDIKSKEQVFIDDNFKSFFYHKLKSETYDEIQGRGKTKTYRAKATLELICYSEFAYFDDHIRNRLSQFSEVTINSTDFDSYKIIAQETAKKDFDFEKFLFVVNYQLLYMTDNCHDKCL